MTGGGLDGVPVTILTLSDTVARGAGEDTSGDAIAEALRAQGARIVRRDVLADDRDAISAALARYADQDRVALVLTTGGSGLGPRDVTPEATLAVIDRLAPGLVEAARAHTHARTPLAMLSRAVAGVRKQTLIVNLPGSPGAVREWLEILLPVLPHAVRVIRGTSGPWGHDHRSEGS
ncbi:MAG: MogA/MoaB family molybdenum cofactor biosynthesis protein [bacterium]